MAWRWINDGDKRGLQIGDYATFHELTFASPARKVELSNRINLQGAVWSILYSARTAYAVGNADYENAVENLTKLLAELFRATSDVETTVGEIFTHIVPVPTAIDKLEDRIALAKEVALYLPMNKPTAPKAEKSTK